MAHISQIERWFYEYGDDVYSFLIYYTGSIDVDDYVQEVFLKAIRSFHTFEERSNPKTWLLSIARNLVIDKNRRKRLIKFQPFDLLGKRHIQIDQSNPERALLLDEVLSDIHDAILRLKQSYKEVLVSRLILELSVEETATVLNWSTNKVSLTYHRAVKALQKNLNSINKGEEKDYEEYLPK
ncbi:RNA polymerase sigma factor [Fredinandcohnia sp. QZ13]|uniref:RNA polymerase sigma factor n=1 Tax=Fredinandcohnia sp. QZ13 TaxID=3073144 RepID=UPI0028531BCC|nr:RNA polymerase sigma factor [Fredinandcohnia sp. QZ13]MDR4889349.1 RNA polymerase sigma factor [Fredinandcohnia sp. QZ13]